MGKHACQLIAAGFRCHDEAKHQELAVDARTAQDAADPAVEAEIDKGRERPDFFRLDEAAELLREARTSCKSAGDRVAEYQAVEYLVMLDLQRGRLDEARVTRSAGRDSAVTWP